MIKCVNYLLKSNTPLTRQPRAFIFSFFKKEKELKPEENKTDEALILKEDWTPLGKHMNELKKQNQSKPKLLPLQNEKYKDKLTLVLELDEVLIYSYEPDPKEMFMTAPMRKHDYFLDLPELETFINVYKREHADEFVKFWLQEFEPVLWSCGDPIYVHRIMDMIWPEFPKDHIFTQEQCNLLELEEEGIEGYFKDVDRLGRDLKKLIYVDGKPLQFWGIGDNSLPVQPFIADNFDDPNELLQLMYDLEKLKKEEDVRIELKKKYNVVELLKESNLL